MQISYVNKKKIILKLQISYVKKKRIIKMAPRSTFSISSLSSSESSSNFKRRVERALYIRLQTSLVSAGEGLNSLGYIFGLSCDSFGLK